MAEQPSYPTALGASDRDTITLLGQDLAEDIMGKVGFGELAFWLATQRRPTPGEVRVFEAVLAALADHGFTPTAIVTRLTYLSAPDSVQGALAAGLLGGGSRFLGVTEDTGRFLHDVLARRTEQLPADDAGWDALALETVASAAGGEAVVPGLGHHVHKEGDPRTPRLMQIAHEEGTFGPHLRCSRPSAGCTRRCSAGRCRSTGPGSAVPRSPTSDCRSRCCAAFALLARTAGLVGQLAEELRHPVANDIFLSVDLNNRPVAPDPWAPDELTGRSGDASRRHRDARPAARGWSTGSLREPGAGELTVAVHGGAHHPARRALRFGHVVLRCSADALRARRAGRRCRASRGRRRSPRARRCGSPHRRGCGPATGACARSQPSPSATSCRCRPGPTPCSSPRSGCPRSRRGWR